MEINSQKELLKYKERIDQLSHEAKESYEKLQELCNEILFTQNLELSENIPTDIDNLTENLLHVLIVRIIEDVNRSHSLLSAYEEYVRKYEELIPELKIEKD